MSCPSASFCVAVDDDGNAFTYNGSSWSTPSRIDTIGDLTSVSCPSSSFCVAVDQPPNGDPANAVTYTNTSTTLPTTSVLVPSNATTVSGSNTTLDASATNASSVQFWLLGGSYGYSGKLLCSATLTYYGWVCSWNTTTVPNGSYALLSEATNTSGSAYSAGVSISVSNTPTPTTSVLVPPTER